MADIRDSRLLYLKGGLFVLAGTLAAGAILLEHPSWKVAVLLAVAVWAFARAYYFAFYVVQHYVDGEYRFAGLLHFVRYTLARRGKGNPGRKEDGEKPAAG
jgi:hypothetical protein